MDELPDLVSAADYLEIDAMLKDSLFQLCQTIPSKSAHELQSIFSMIPESLVPTLLHCTNDKSPELWLLKRQAIVSRNQFGSKCKLATHFDILKLETMMNAPIECLKYLKKNRLNLILPSKFIFKYDTAKYLGDSALLLKEMGIKISLNGICKKLLSQSVDDFKSLFSQITMPEHRNALLHCVSDNAPSNWALRNEPLEKRQEFQSKCNLGQKVHYSVFYIYNAQPACLKYMKENHLNLITASNFCLEYDNLKDLILSSAILNNLEFFIYLFLAINVDASELVEALEKVPNLTSLRILKSEQTIDLSLFPDMPQLQRLVINQCRLSHVSGFLNKDFPELITLDLSKNQLGDIGKIEFMPKLQFLNLANNGIENVSQLLESHLPKLKTLILNYNKIQAMGKINEMRNLKVIQLYRNQITDLSGLLQSELPELEELSIIHNPMRIKGVINSMPKLKRPVQ
jgi:hypothetical protein